MPDTRPVVAANVAGCVGGGNLQPGLLNVVDSLLNRLTQPALLPAFQPGCHRRASVAAFQACGCQISTISTSPRACHACHVDNSNINPNRWHNSTRAYICLSLRLYGC